jgi:hypothetical protein
LHISWSKKRKINVKKKNTTEYARNIKGLVCGWSGKPPGRVMTCERVEMFNLIYMLQQPDGHAAVLKQVFVFVYVKMLLSNGTT